MAKAEVLPVSLTGRRIELMKAIQQFWEENNYAPTDRELTRIMGLASVSTTYAHLVILRDGGLVTWAPGLPRTLRITQFGKGRLASIGVL